MRRTSINAKRIVFSLAVVGLICLLLFSLQLRTSASHARLSKAFGRLTLKAFGETQTSLVVTNTNDSGPGSLRQALADANDGDTITFDLSLPATITLSDDLSVDKNVTIDGPGAAMLAVDGNQFATWVIIQGKTATISGLSIVNGYNGILNEQSAMLTLNHCTVSGNQALYEGGGILNQGALTINNSTISGNRTTATPGSFTRGAGISNYGTLAINNSTVNGNVSSAAASITFGGGIFNNNSLTITSSIISNNTAQIGGGIYNDDFGVGSAILTIHNSVINGNTAGNGGGVYNTNNGVLSVDNCTINGNSATFDGGGTFNDATINIASSTISGNSADLGGGVYNRDGNAGVTSISNSTLSGNSASSQGGGIYNLGHDTAQQLRSITAPLPATSLCHRAEASSSLSGPLAPPV